MRKNPAACQGELFSFAVDNLSRAEEWDSEEKSRRRISHSLFRFPQQGVRRNETEPRAPWLRPGPSLELLHQAVNRLNPMGADPEHRRAGLKLDSDDGPVTAHPCQTSRRWPMTRR